MHYEEEEIFGINDVKKITIRVTNIKTREQNQNKEKLFTYCFSCCIVKAHSDKALFKRKN